MEFRGKKSSCKKNALLFSVLFLSVWTALGTSVSLAWFSDASTEICNIFHFYDFEISVSHLTADGEWETVNSGTELFDDKALYEPGYVQVAYLKVQNLGDDDISFYTAVSVSGCTAAVNVFGHRFMLQDYLRFGIAVADSETGIKNSTSDRGDAAAFADMPLHHYDTDVLDVAAGESVYLALVLYMPGNADNAANYTGDTLPKLELGITVKAEPSKNKS